MPPRNLFLSIALGAFATLAHPFTFLGNAFGRLRLSAGRSRAGTARWTPELLKRLEWRRFEELCAAYFEALGFRAELAGSSAHGGAGISLYQQDAERASILVQCKPWNAYRVGLNAVRDLRERMTSAKVAEGVLTTSGRFTQEARVLAAKEKISLIDGTDLLGKIAALSPETAQRLLELATEGDFITPTCPACAVKMVARKSTAHGRTFWGCRNYPRCKQTFFSTVNASG